MLHKPVVMYRHPIRSPVMQVPIRCLPSPGTPLLASDPNWLPTPRRYKKINPKQKPHLRNSSPKMQRFSRLTAPVKKYLSRSRSRGRPRRRSLSPSRGASPTHPSRLEYDRDRNPEQSYTSLSVSTGVSANPSPATPRLDGKTISQSPVQVLGPKPLEHW